MKQLARSSVYWPRMDKDIADTCHKCTAGAENQNPPKVKSSLDVTGEALVADSYRPRHKFHGK